VIAWRRCLGRKRIVVSLERTGRGWFATLRRRKRQIRSIVENIIHRSFRLVQRALAVVEPEIGIAAGSGARWSSVVCRYGFSRNHCCACACACARACEGESRSIYRVATRYRLHTHYSAFWMLSAWASRDDVVGLL
jgi:hypothetical protein